jgi:hypothetical protein
MAATFLSIEAVMFPRWIIFAPLCAILASAPAHAGKQQKPCVPPDQAAQQMNKDTCVQAHVYDVVELPDGTRFLDVCTPQTPDAQCRFTIVSLREDRDTVGDLQKMRDADIEIRGIVQQMHGGRARLMLSHARQFYGGPPKFKPNPRLARGFTGEAEKPPLADPNLKPQGRVRAFMNTKEIETKHSASN